MKDQAVWLREARERDAEDPGSHWREQFVMPDQDLYFDGNSLGLLSHRARLKVHEMLDSWGRLAVSGWGETNPSWFALSELVARQLAPFVGAEVDEVSLGGSTTVQLHQLLATLYHPTGSRHRIVMDAGAFPTDRYAVESHLRLRGLEPDEELRVVSPGTDRLLDEDALVASLEEDVALAVWPSVVFTTGQALDVAKLTRAAEARGVLIIWDLSHSAGLLPHQLHRDGVDAAVFCTYKYLSGGTGSPGALFLHARHLPVSPGMTGWWGSDKAVQFKMDALYRGASTAGALQLGTPHMLSLAALQGSVEVLRDMGLAPLGARSRALVEFLQALVEDILVTRGMSQVTPKEARRRGGHLALARPAAGAISLALRAEGAVPDFRPPDLLRVAPSPAVTRYEDLVRFVFLIARILDQGTYHAYESQQPSVV